MHLYIHVDFSFPLQYLYNHLVRIANKIIEDLLNTV